MNSDQGTELRSGRIISSSLETPVPTDPDMAQSSANDSDSNETSDISSQLSEIRESYERKINELQNEFSQLKDLMMVVISKTDSENRPSTSKGPSKPAHTVGLDRTPYQPLYQKTSNKKKTTNSTNQPLCSRPVEFFSFLKMENQRKVCVRDPWKALLLAYKIIDINWPLERVTSHLA